MKTARSYLMVAILLGLMAAGGTAWYITQAEAAANPTEAIVVARTGIPARTVLTEDFLTVKKLPKGAVLPNTSNTMDDFLGKTTQQSMVAGEQILPTKLFRDRAATGLAFVLPEGHRAVAIQANELIAAGGLVVPGDSVDVVALCVVDSKPGDQSSKIARVAYSLQRLEVLAVAQDIAGQEGAAPKDALRAQNPSSMLAVPTEAQARPAAKSITLSLTPQESEKLLLLEEHPSCSLRLALRAKNDTSTIPSGVLDFNPSLSMDPIVKP